VASPIGFVIGSRTSREGAPLGLGAPYPVQVVGRTGGASARERLDRSRPKRYGRHVPDGSPVSSRAPGHVIALVASAGGLQAVATVLERLPGDLDAAVIVLIHQEPDRSSSLADIFARRSRLLVVAAAHERPLLAGAVVVAQPGVHILVTPGPRIATIASGISPPNRPSADLLLTTLAIACGERAIAVVLSGGPRRRDRGHGDPRLRRDRHRLGPGLLDPLRDAPGHHRARRDHRSGRPTRRHRRGAGVGRRRSGALNP
jgi:hypothetical protein